MKDFETLRSKYKEFIYREYEISEDKNCIKIQYKFEIPDLKVFTPTIEIDKNNIEFTSIDNDVIKNIVFNIGMVEALSYWKCACPKKMIVECGKLNNEQIQWFKKLYYYGLGEYRYINNIDISMKQMIQIECNYKEECETNVNKTYEKKELIGTLIPIGGGKDSCVTLELLEQNKEENLCIMIGGKMPSIEAAKVAGYEQKIVHIKRIIDKNLLELNKQGFLNGHTPFSAMLAFLSYLIATLTGKKYIALSNESSANESNVEGEKINHQYSKSFEFEQDFRNYANKYLKTNVEYFSMLRPLNELQIAMLFARKEKYHSIFRSCNVGSKTIPWNWCGNCPKCLFVYVILSPFLYKEKLINIFKEDLFEKQELLNIFIELCGYGKTKPFECVGTYEEVNFAITKTIKSLENKNFELPYLLEYYKRNYNLSDINEDLSKKYNEENNLPKELDSILRKAIFNDWKNS